MDRDRPEGRGDDFAAALARLKRRGSAVLVTSQGGDAGVCRDLLGGEGERRRRLLVRGAAFDRLPVPADSVVIDATADDTRSAAAVEPIRTDQHLAGGWTIDTVSTAITNEIDRVASPEPAPGEIRVCLGQLDVFLERGDLGSVERAVRAVTDDVRSVRGMAHAHLASTVPRRVGDTLTPLFDVTVELRTSPAGVVQQRWRLHDAEIDTGWLDRRSR